MWDLKMEGIQQDGFKTLAGWFIFVYTFNNSSFVSIKLRDKKHPNQIQTSLWLFFRN